jgi:hypothetical protein
LAEIAFEAAFLGGTYAYTITRENPYGLDRLTAVRIYIIDGNDFSGMKEFSQWCGRRGL